MFSVRTQEISGISVMRCRWQRVLWPRTELVGSGLPPEQVPSTGGRFLPVPATAESQLLLLSHTESEILAAAGPG